MRMRVRGLLEVDIAVALTQICQQLQDGETDSIRITCLIGMQIRIRRTEMDLRFKWILPTIMRRVATADMVLRPLDSGRRQPN